MESLGHPQGFLGYPCANKESFADVSPRFTTAAPLMGFVVMSGGGGESEGEGEGGGEGGGGGRSPTAAPRVFTVQKVTTETNQRSVDELGDGFTKEQERQETRDKR